MASHTVRDLLERSRQFHQEMAQYYRKLDNEADQERVHLLLGYLQRHEQHLESCLAAYTKEVSDSVLATWFKFSPEVDLPDCSSLFTVDPNLSVDDVVALAMRYDQCLIQLYRQAEENAALGAVRELFANLRTMAEAEEHQLARDTVEMQDL